MTKLEKLLKYVSENNEFYKNIIREYGITDPLDITQYPVLTRQQLQQNRYNMFSENAKSEYYRQNLVRTYSSGTKGIPVNVYWSHQDYYSSIKEIWKLRKEYYNIDPLSKQLNFTLRLVNCEPIKKLKYTYSKNGKVLSIARSSIINSQSFLELDRLIKCFEPDWFYIQPSILKWIIEQYEIYKIDLPKSIKYIECAGEILPLSLKRRAINLFNVPLANMYGSEEMNSIAFECPYNHMHILSNNVYVEFVPIDNSEQKAYKALLTNLNNRTMPLIRYDQGDIIVPDLLGNNCKCRNLSQSISIVGGRVRDSVYINNNLLSSSLLVEVIDEVNNILNDIIKSFSFMYDKEKGLLICKYSIYIDRYNWRHIIEEKTIDALTKRNILVALKFEYLKEYSIYSNLTTKDCILSII